MMNNHPQGYQSVPFIFKLLVDGGGAIFLSHPFSFCYGHLKPHAKFQNNPFWEKSNPRRMKERKKTKTINSGHYVLQFVVGCLQFSHTKNSASIACSFLRIFLQCPIMTNIEDFLCIIVNTQPICIPIRSML